MLQKNTITIEAKPRPDREGEGKSEEVCWEVIYESEVMSSIKMHSSQKYTCSGCVRHTDMHRDGYL